MNKTKWGNFILPFYPSFRQLETFFCFFSLKSCFIMQLSLCVIQRIDEATALCLYIHNKRVSITDLCYLAAKNKLIFKRRNENCCWWTRLARLGIKFETAVKCFCSSGVEIFSQDLGWMRKHKLWLLCPITSLS